MCVWWYGPNRLADHGKQVSKAKKQDSGRALIVLRQHGPCLFLLSIAYECILGTDTFHDLYGWISAYRRKLCVLTIPTKDYRPCPTKAPIGT